MAADPDPLPPALLLALRGAVALVWLEQGLWRKLLAVDPEHLRIVRALGPVGPLSPERLLWLIGLGETALAAAVLAGVRHREVSGAQIAALLAMNAIGIAWGGAPPVILIHNLPLLLCIAVLGRCGPGPWSLGSRG